jgi:hypothetical protein
MKNFLDLLAIEPELTISVVLNPIVDNGPPGCRLSINGHNLFYGDLVNRLTCNFKTNLIDPFDLKIELYNKIYNIEKETAIEIESIRIDSFEIIPNWTHLASYHNDHDINAPTSYLGFNGHWQLNIDRPFYHWLHVQTGQGWLLEPI